MKIPSLFYFHSTLLEINKRSPLGKLSKLKSGEIWETVQSGDDPPPPLAGLGLF